MSQLIAVVDCADRVIGYRGKDEVHREGLLHRAFSILVFNSRGEVLLQRRALSKYHSPGLWTNTCCSHLPENSEMQAVVHHRLVEEMGFDCELTHLFTFTYRVELPNGLIENELDHVYVGRFDGIPKPHGDEVCDWKWLPPQVLLADVDQNPDDYTYWFKHIVRNYWDKFPRYQ